ncbi:hypothetical protein pb186bvf_010895 [Paramecium bursaria]
MYFILSQMILASYLNLINDYLFFQCNPNKPTEISVFKQEGKSQFFNNHHYDQVLDNVFDFMSLYLLQINQFYNSNFSTLHFDNPLQQFEKRQINSSGLFIIQENRLNHPIRLIDRVMVIHRTKIIIMLINYEMETNKQINQFYLTYQNLFITARYQRGQRFIVYDK